MSIPCRADKVVGFVVLLLLVIVVVVSIFVDFASKPCDCQSFNVSEKVSLYRELGVDGSLSDQLYVDVNGSFVPIGDLQ